jgi:hypothetical protein
MMSVILIACIALCLNCFALFNHSAKEKIPETPVGLWLIHILSCCISGIIYHKMNIYGAPFLLWIANFLIIFFDTRLSTLWAQISFIFAVCILVGYRIGFTVIISQPNGIGWLMFFLTSLLPILPIIVGIIFVRNLLRKEFPGFAISTIVSTDYLIGLIIADIILNHLS